MYTLYVYHTNKDDLMTNLFISLYPFYFIILAAKTATQITNIILPTWKRGYVYIILVPQKQRRLNDESVYIIISFLLHYSGCQNRHAKYKFFSCDDACLFSLNTFKICLFTHEMTCLFVYSRNDMFVCLLTKWHVCLFTHEMTCLFVYSRNDMFVCLLTKWYVCLFTHEMTRLFVYSRNDTFVCLLTKWHVCLFTHEMTRLFVYSRNDTFVCLLTKWHVCLFTHEMTRLFVYSRNDTFPITNTVIKIFNNLCADKHMFIIHHGQTNCISDKKMVGQSVHPAPICPARGGQHVKMGPIYPRVQVSLCPVAHNRVWRVFRVKLEGRITWIWGWHTARILTWKSPIFGCGRWKIGRQNF